MNRSSSSFRVVVVGGTVAAAALEVCAELTRTSGFALIVWCPTVSLDELRGVSRYPVQHPHDRVALAADRVYLVPADRRITIDGDGDAVIAAAERGSFDHVLRSVADSFGTDAVGIVLAGHGTDGSLGIKRIKEVGGLAIAQQVTGSDAALPAAAIETGFIDLILPLGQITAQVVGANRDPRWPLSESNDPDAANDLLRDILMLVRVRSGHDFSSYKRATLYRRIGRRMQVCGCATLDAYHRYLREHPHELPHLLRDFLISVTNFFRDGEAFAALRKEVVPRLFANKSASDQVRVWVAGCATGEEAYSIGMLLLEHAETQSEPPTIQVFATDIDETALAEARLGCYPDAIEADVTPERLARFFTRENGQYRVTKQLRETLLFSPHNVLRDPPFSRLDLVSCRNLLIYLDREAQARVLATFHFGLRATGVLFLGSSESPDSTTLFRVLDSKQRLFLRQDTVATVGGALAVPTRWQSPARVEVPPRERVTSVGELHHRIVEYYAPPSMLLDSDLNVVHVSEHAGAYLQITGGEPTRQALRLVHPALRLELRTAIYAARQSGNERRIVRHDIGGGQRQLDLRVRTVEVPDLGPGGMLVTFEELPDAAQPAPAAAVAASSSMEPVVRELEDELHRTRDQLRMTVDQYETSVEDLKASNEELQAINEELRSATEELETSKEELQSVNEELTTLNHELKIKVDETSHANSDLQNLMMSTEIGVVFLDRQLNIKRFTPRIQDVFNIIASDVGRPLAHVTHRLQYDDLAETAQTVLQTLRTIDKEVTTRDGKSYLVRWLPYRSVDDHIDGVVMTLIDVSDLRDAVDARRRTETELQLVEERLRTAVRIAPIAVLSFDAALTLTWAYFMGHELGDDNLDLINIFSRAEADVMGGIVRAVATDRKGSRVELAVKIRDEDRIFDFCVEPSATSVIIVGFDITARKLAEAKLRESDRRKDEFFATLSHEIRNPLAPLKIAIEVARIVGDDAEQRAESLAVMERQVGMLSELVDELLDLSRITQGKVRLDLQPFDIAEILDVAVQQARPLIDGASHELRLALPPHPIYVTCDRGRVVQVFGNLLVNAAKYTPAHGVIEVRVHADAANQRVTVQIRDTGIGISADALDTIFDIFVQSRDAEGRAQGGLGIGLNVVRRLVEMHGGVVTASSDGAGHGSAFTVELPIAPH